MPNTGIIRKFKATFISNPVTEMKSIRMVLSVKKGAAFKVEYAPLKKNASRTMGIILSP